MADRYIPKFCRKNSPKATKYVPLEVELPKDWTLVADGCIAVLNVGRRSYKIGHSQDLFWWSITLHKADGDTFVLSRGKEVTFEQAMKKALAWRSK